MIKRTAHPILLIVVVVVVGIVAAAYVFYYQHTGSSVQQPPISEMQKADPLVDFKAHNVNYLLAKDAFDKHDYRTAAKYYALALDETTDPQVRGSVQLTYGVSTSIFDPKVGVSIVKQVADNTAYASTTRGFAIQQMGIIRDAALVPDILPDIFSGQPYESFYTGSTSSFTALKNLFEYANTFGSYWVAHEFIADWYAFQLRDAATGAVAMSTTTAESYRQALRAEQAAADAVEAESQGQNPYYKAIASFLRAETLAVLMLAGEPVTQSYKNAFAKAIANAPIDGGGKDSVARYNYASYLFQIEGAMQSKDEIHTVMQPIYADTSEMIYPTFFEYMRNIRKGLFFTQKKDIVQFANMVPEFKTLLLAHGWSDSDFVDTF